MTCKSKKISLSAYKKYHTCPKMYEYHYKDRIRPEKVGPALRFGIAFDRACNAMLLKTGEDPTEVFRDNFSWKECQDVIWSKWDIDERLIEPRFLEEVKSKGQDHLAWACLRVKGRLLIEAYKRDIIPHIEKVISVQEELDDRPGFIDFIAMVNGKETLVDNKTSGRPYAPDSVREDLQLAVYTYSKGLDRAAFAVAIKNIPIETQKKCRKCKYVNRGTMHRTCPALISGERCGGQWDETHTPRPYCQWIVDDIAPELKETLQEELGTTEAAIKAEVYPRILNSCKSLYGAPCPYYKKCWHKDDTGLKKEEK